VYDKNLRKGKSKSCGCLRRELLAAGMNSHPTHGHYVGGVGTSTYYTWLCMRARCSYPRTNGYQRYGGRGIKVCDEWRKSFPAFLRDMGERPAKHTLDRINPDGHYEPQNCRWADARLQRHNRSLRPAGEPRA
jgi:hypothetical protein